MLNDTRMAQVTDNPDMAEGSSIHRDAKQQLHQYLRTYIQPLMRAGKPMDLKDILDHVKTRKPKLVQKLGVQQAYGSAASLIQAELRVDFSGILTWPCYNPLSLFIFSVGIVKRKHIFHFVLLTHAHIISAQLILLTIICNQVTVKT